MALCFFLHLIKLLKQQMALLDRNPTEMEAVPYIKKTKDKNVIDKVIL